MVSLPRGGWWTRAFCGGFAPTSPESGRSAPLPGKILQGPGPLRPTICRRSALHPGDFPVAGKVTKGAPRAAALWNPASTKKRPFWCCANACTRAAFYHKKRPICHFEQVGKSVLFFPLVPSREHSVFSIRGAADSLPPRMLDGLSYRKQYRYGRRPGDQRGQKLKRNAFTSTPFAGGPGTRRFLVSLW